jgi:16S rRNA C967 or C1407 C5-methylase (RsmB/RsmF family)
MRKRAARLLSRPFVQMITLDTYVQHVYQYAPPATTEHLRRTVWEPLGLSLQTASSNTNSTPPSHESVYAVAPLTTNLRCTGADITTQLRRLVCVATAFDGGAVGDVAAKPPASPATVMAARYVAPVTLGRWGLPFCACVRPHVDLLAQWPPSFPLSPSTPLSPSPAAAPSTTESSEVPLVIVVDAGAAEAVLRGSDLYAPGIITASRVFCAGEEALVAFYVERVLADEDSSASSKANAGRTRSSAMQGVKKSKGEDAAAVTSTTATTGKANEEDDLRHPSKATSACWRIASSLTAGVTLAPTQYVPLVNEGETTAAALRHRSSFLVCVGSGRLFMGWKEVLGRRTRGVALRTDWTPQLQPSRAILRRLLHVASPTSSSAEGTLNDVAEGGGRPEEPHDVFFLQNYSSMVPVSLLVEHLPVEAFQRRCTVLDACAAPGGKTSLLLSLLQTRSENEGVAGLPGGSFSTQNPFCVVCCERSRPRHEQLMKLLHEHFPSPGEGSADGDLLSWALESHCADTNKFLKRSQTTPADGFDAVLLDPPCTGLGLRPKLLPHTHTIASIQQSADYQRKLFDSCVRHLRGTPASPGVLVYSTCTTTLEENEANVVHFLRTYPSLRLARATTAAHHALCKLSVTTYPHLFPEARDAKGGVSGAPLSSPMVLLSQEILALQKEKEASAAAHAAGASVVSSDDAPLLVLRFMPRHLPEYGDPSEDSVGFFAAVFLCFGHDN